MTVTVWRRDIQVTQSGRFSGGFDDPHIASTKWTAKFAGNLSTREYVEILEQTGATFAEALANLEAAIAEQGWEIR